MICWVVLMLLMFTLSQLDQGSKYKSFIWLSYLLKKMYHYIKIISMILFSIYEDFILHYQHMISQSYKWYYYL